ncbi:hypothetical protein [Staphylococcus carnosus]|uniref:Uncharacterized protein n=1 Tax=Staphylococcus carnosus (strain TM300) TaxID=396513 RepID=B9DJD1_STACT|nr:hypothetical protein [Staphylococcus carnosus]QPT03582.1 hypothetical protein I6G40_10940 [Staphylococcus carnosus]UQA66305.1 hypothetical protein Sta3580_06975 [Staphylococcus carnosus]UTB78856.1 hypothetical protein A2I62_09945 [Staphylococcus carnosus]UTB88409.1 hypothetical protein A2I63_09945 [Staphylococcus carnosus]UTB90757.1 hypothetical protein A2I64_09940 [Staphylococcus carnosus]
MIKKAIKRPDVVEYIEFKGKENFKEVCEFIGRSEPLLTRTDGKEYLLLNHYVSDKEDAPIYPGTIFYRWYDFEQDCKPWGVMNKGAFFKRYMED